MNLAFLQWCVGVISVLVMTLSVMGVNAEPFQITIDPIKMARMGCVFTIMVKPARGFLEWISERITAIRVLRPIKDKKI